MLIQTQQILNKYFEEKCDGDKCRLFLSLLKYRGMNIVRKSLVIKMIKPSRPSSHIVKSLVDAFGKIGKNTRSNDRNAARRVLSQAIVNKKTRVLGFLKPTSKLVNLKVKPSVGILLEENISTQPAKQIFGPLLVDFHVVT